MAQRLEMVLVLAAVACCGEVARAEGPVGWMVELTLDGRKIEGLPLSWDDANVHLMGRDGRLWKFAPNAAKDFKKTGDTFRGYSSAEFRAALAREFGGGYEVTGTAHYMVAHPAGQGAKWAERFEDLYRSFTHYFSVRGFAIKEPRFPLVGVVCRDRNDFAQRAAAGGEPAPNGVLGYYNVESNRITLYDMGGKTDSRDWRRNAGVLIHEATHQTAFNLGVHSRLALPPTWLAEGLAMLFEAPGVHDSRSHPDLKDRINGERLKVFQTKLRPRHKPEVLTALIASEESFGVNPGAAYAEAWALTFFLVETEPAKYARYLRLTATRPPLAEYSDEERVKDFTAIFGGDWRMLEARFLRFMADLPPASP